MNKRRNVFVLLILILISLGIFFGPNVMNLYIKKDLVESKDLWKYEEPENLEVTSKTFAQMYVDQTFESSSVYSNAYNDADILDQETIKTQLREVLDSVFGKNETALNKFEDMLNEYNLESYERQVLLTVVENRAISFVFVLLQFSNGVDNIQIAYEEKTSTLIGFLYEMWIPEKADWDFINSARVCLVDYNVSTLELKPEQYGIICYGGEERVSLEATLGYLSRDIESDESYIYEEGVHYYNKYTY